jgi:ubiquinone/menaquinone biosynthesis C-methylase UbiE
MSGRTHDDVARDSFRSQVEAFSRSDSVYARRDGTLSWIEPLDTSMILLDVACGAAHAAESVAPAVRQVVGIDLTPELLEVGAARLKESGVTNVLLQEANAQELPFVDGSFNVVFCRSSLHHFADPHGAVTEMARVARSGGRIVIVDLVAPRGVDHERFDDLHRLLDPSHVRTFLEEELVAVFPDRAAVIYGQTSTMRFPIDVAIEAQSDREAVLSALRSELDGAAPTGFDPVEDKGSIEVAFTISAVHAAVP